MLYAVLIFDPTKFMIFEYYTDKSVANHVVNFVENLIDKEQEIEDDSGRKFFVKSISPKFDIAVVYHSETITDQISENLIEIGLKVIQGDKLILRQVLNSEMLSNFAFVS